MDDGSQKLVWVEGILMPRLPNGNYRFGNNTELTPLAATDLVRQINERGGGFGAWFQHGDLRCYAHVERDTLIVGTPMSIEGAS